MGVALCPAQRMDPFDPLHVKATFLPAAKILTRYMPPSSQLSNPAARLHPSRRLAFVCLEALVESLDPSVGVLAFANLHRQPIFIGWTRSACLSR